jgi:hypothetical protein
MSLHVYIYMYIFMSLWWICVDMYALACVHKCMFLYLYLSVWVCRGWCIYKYVCALLCVWMHVSVFGYTHEDGHIYAYIDTPMSMVICISLWNCQRADEMKVWQESMEITRSWTRKYECGLDYLTGWRDGVGQGLLWWEHSEETVLCQLSTRPQSQEPPEQGRVSLFMEMA